jgi:hypothetical protein
MWGKKYCDSNPNTALKDVIGNFLEYIQFHKIPANVLMREVHPLGLVPYSIIMNALAYQVMQSIPVIKSNNRHVSVAKQRLVEFVSMVTQQYVTTQQSFNALLAGFSVGRSIRDSLLLCNG